MLLVIQKKTFTFYIYLVCTKLSLGEKAHRISSVESVGLGPEARICQPDAFMSPQARICQPDDFMSPQTVVKKVKC